MWSVSFECGVVTRHTHQAACEVYAHRPLVLSQRPVGERVEAYPPRVVI